MGHDGMENGKEKYVMKNSLRECILFSPEEYIDELNDARLLTVATCRMSHFNPSTFISQEQVDQEFGFAPCDYEDTDDIELE